jgi:hypothetical protein
VAGESDGVFGAGDFIEFYGAPNDGLLDREMFTSANEQAQIFKSLFSDTAIYFLTVLPDSSVQIPQRFAAYNEADYANAINNDYFSSATFINANHNLKNSSGWNNDKLIVLHRNDKPCF